MKIMQNFWKRKGYLKGGGYSKQNFHFGRFEGGVSSEGEVLVVKPPDSSFN